MENEKPILEVLENVHNGLLKVNDELKTITKENNPYTPIELLFTIGELEEITRVIRRLEEKWS